MHPEEKIESFDIRRILLPEEFQWSYLLEVCLRTSIMFLILLIFLKLSGKRSVKQLSFFELAIVVGLGSAAGDPMFYHDVPLLPVVVVFIVIALMYKLLTYVTRVSDRAEKLIEGEPDLLLENDLIVTDKLDTDDLSYDEFFAFLRVNHVEHLGQVRRAYLETTGEISIYFYDEHEVKPGLPILPGVLKRCSSTTSMAGMYSCGKCGFTDSFRKGIQPVCPNCKSNRWLLSSSAKRIT